MTQKYIISLSSIPPRFGQLQSTLNSLLAQTVPAEKVILYLNRQYRRFPEWDGTPPEVPDGVDIRWVDEDWGPATKLLPALRDFAGQDMDILYCDDDQDYQPWLAERMLKARVRRPADAIAVSSMWDFKRPDGAKRRFDKRPRRLFLWRVTNVGFHLRSALRHLKCWLTGQDYVMPDRRRVLRSGYADGAEGWMGVMVRPEFFPEEVFDVPEFAWPVDDVWFSGQMARKGHGVWVIGGFLEPYLTPVEKPAHTDDDALFKAEFEGKKRRQLNNEAARYFQETYGLWS